MNDIEFCSESGVELIDFMGGDEAVARSAWVSYNGDSDDKLKDKGRVKGLIKFLMREQHMTPFESSVITFCVDTPIFVAREYFRHRSASYNEISARYVVLPSKFYIPSPDRPLVQEGKAGHYRFTPGTEEQYAITKNNLMYSYREARDSYNRILAAGVAKEVARDVLPVGTYTRFYATMNVRNLMHFLNLRTESQALHEIQEVANKMEELWADKMPMTYEAWQANK